MTPFSQHTLNPHTDCLLYHNYRSIAEVPEGRPLHNNEKIYTQVIDKAVWASVRSIVPGAIGTGGIQYMAVGTPVTICQSVVRIIEHLTPAKQV